MTDKLNPTSLEEMRNLSALERVRIATKNQTDDRKDALDSENRVKVLSPGMLVFKRFVRNKLAIMGSIILLAMFLFSFVAALLSPYGQTEIFTRLMSSPTNVASVSNNRDYKALTQDGKSLKATVRAKFALARSKKQSTFKDGDTTYSLTSLETGSWIVGVLENQFQVTNSNVQAPSDRSDEFKAALSEAMDNESTTFTADGEIFVLDRGPVRSQVLKQVPYALMSKFDFYTASSEYEDLAKDLAFRVAAENAYMHGDSSFTYDGQDYGYEKEEELQTGRILSQGQEVMLMSTWSVKATDGSLALDLPLIDRLVASAVHQDRGFDWEMDHNGEKVTVPFTVTRSNYDFTVSMPKEQEMIDIYAAPSAKHWLGTDDKGMDQITRLMYGGRISLMVGFVVVSITLVIGVVVGGISGYFGGWVDLLCMRFIDLFNSIPYFPVMIITGTVMDKMEIPSTQRIFLLMGIMGLMSWTGIARVVRGQILSLREQDFMIATEATGLSIRKRIFRHLVPNVMPLLIVQATMSLGGIIISEATLSFLGLGVKPPLASWGSIINAANNQYVMSNCWWIWLPTGILIVLTVLGFNFVGDGLRDAYDPKMKR